MDAFSKGQGRAKMHTGASLRNSGMWREIRDKMHMDASRDVKRAKRCTQKLV